MNAQLNYITDSRGNSKGIIISQKDWEKWQKKYDMLKNKLDVLLGIEQAFEEVKEIKTGKRKIKTLREFLNEL